MTRGQGKRSALIVEAAHAILQEIQPATVRAVAYKLFAAGFIAGMNKVGSVGRLLRIAREDGVIPWEWIVDETRVPETAATYENPEELVRCAVSWYRRDHWQGQRHVLEVWSEKGAVAGTLRPVLDKFGVTFRIMRGFASATVVNDIADLAGRSSKPLIALYVGDWDCSGLYMSDVDLPRRLEAYSYGGDITLKRIALVRGDLRDLPSFAAKTTDKRFRWSKVHFGTRCWELDALSPPLLRARVERHIRRYIDLPKWQQSLTCERAEVESMQHFQQIVARCKKPPAVPPGDDTP